MVSIIIFYFLFIQFSEIIQAEHSPCGDWTPFRDEKCFKVLPGKMVSFQDALKSCLELDSASTLPTIKSQAEQDFLVDLLFTKSKVVNNLWLGATYLSGKYVWLDDNSPLDGGYRNWERSQVKNVSQGRCIEMEADEGRRGKWIDEPCTKLNLLVCQKRPIWSISYIQQTLLETRKELAQSKADSKAEIISLKQSLLEAKKELAQVKANTVPIGFTYVQLANSPAPGHLWPSMTWTEISSAYAGVFFRVAGGKAATFGSIQEETSPWLKQVDYVSDCPATDSSTILKKGSWSGNVVSGIFEGGRAVNCMKFLTTDDEVRPKNMAVQVWKRTA